MSKQVFIPALGQWFNVMKENENFYGVVDSDGINHLVTKGTVPERESY